MARAPLTKQQRTMALVSVLFGLGMAAAGTWGPYKGVWINGMIPVNVVGGVLVILALILLVFGAARRDP